MEMAKGRAEGAVDHMGTLNYWLRVFYIAEGGAEGAVDSMGTSRLCSS